MRAAAAGEAIRRVEPIEAAPPPFDLSRASAFVRQLQAELAQVARCQAATAEIIAELRP
jgi:hypothetical protein